MSGETGTPAPLRLDLTGSTVDEVAELLRAGGFSIRVEEDQESNRMWNFWRSSNPSHPLAKGKSLDDPVTIIWMEPSEAALLTVIDLTGEEVTLLPYMDLHAIARSSDWSEGVDWFALRSMDLMTIRIDPALLGAFLEAASSQ
jgi:hypothetical protein